MTFKKLLDSDMVNKRFGRLVIEYRNGSSNARKRTWFCKCDCGGNTITTTGNLRSGNASSCGCLFKEVARKIHKTHGMRYTNTYTRWLNMLDRCRNTRNAGYKRYGMRGVKVCKRWMRFENFFRDMGEAPKGLTLDRIDNDKGYSKQNCRWITIKEQQRNKSSNRLVTMDGKTLCLSAWAELYGKHESCIRRRLNRGWPIEAAIKLPRNYSKLVSFLKKSELERASLLSFYNLSTK